MKKKIYDVLIIGAGVSGAAQLFLLSKYTNIKSIGLIEKEEGGGQVNSKHTHNSQTLHEGDIETNYSFEKAKQVQFAASFTRNYVLSKKDSELRLKGPKMVLGVGDKQVKFLDERFKKFKTIYPKMQKLDKKELIKLEPNVFKNRSKFEDVVGLYTQDGLTINYGLLAKTLINDAKKNSNVQEILFNTKVKNVKKIKNGYEIKTNKNVTMYAKVLVFATGAHSLLYAKRLGYGKHYSLLSVAGNFYYTPKYIKTKIYTIQNDKLPFAAVHGDPDITKPNMTRFGPTTNVVLMLERNKYKTVTEYFKSLGLSLKAIRSFVKILSDKDFFWYALKHNLTFRLPFVGNYYFLKEVRKIIPSLKYSELKIAKGNGGVRPQIVDTINKEKPLQLGEARLEGENVLFNITPSPGASTCIYNAYKDTSKIIRFLGKDFKFDENKFLKDLDIKKKLNK